MRSTNIKKKFNKFSVLLNVILLVIIFVGVAFFLPKEQKSEVKTSINIESIEKVNEVVFLNVIVPKFEVIGVELSKDNPYNLYDNHGELLSGTTEDVDTGKLVTNQLSSDKQAEYLDKFNSEIKESAINYYKTLFSSMDSEAKVTVEFSE